MKTHFEIPYSRYALIAELAKRSDSLGRTALQKYVYLLQTLFGINLGYDFSLYTYGPFTSRLLSDLDVAETIEAVDVGTASNSYGGYVIKPGNDAERIKSQAVDFLNEHASKFDQLFRDFGHFNAKELELRSTIVYAEQESPDISAAELKNVVQEIKPGFTPDQILAAISELEEKGYVFKNRN